MSLSCPTCADGITTISQHVSPDQIVTAASAGNAEDIALYYPDEYSNPFPDSPGQPNFLTGRGQAMWSGPRICNSLSEALSENDLANNHTDTFMAFESRTGKERIGSR